MEAQHSCSYQGIIQILKHVKQSEEKLASEEDRPPDKPLEEFFN